MKKLVLAIAFIGMGGFAMAQQTVTPQDKQARRAEMQQKMQEREQKHMDQMQKDLNLNQSQVAQIKELHEKRKSEMKAKRAQMDADMKKILTPDQYTKWQADRKAKMEQRKVAMKDRKMMKRSINTAAQEAK